jgi:hypothetical protein
MGKEKKLINKIAERVGTSNAQSLVQGFNNFSSLIHFQIC